MAQTEAVKSNKPVAVTQQPASSTLTPQEEKQRLQKSIFAVSQTIDKQQDDKNTFGLIALSCFLAGVGLRSLYPLFRNPQLIKNPILSKIFSNSFARNTNLIAGEMATIGSIFSTIRLVETHIDQNYQIKQLNKLNNKLENKLDTKS